MKMGYKVLDMNMKELNSSIKFKLNATYIYDGNIKCNKSGFHYFESIEEIMLYYNLKNIRIFVCELNGNLFDDSGYSHCTNRIRLIKEFTQKDILFYIQDNIDTLSNSSDYRIRRNVANIGLCLSKLIYDKNYTVRIAVADNNYKLHILKNDRDERVRCNLVRKGYAINKFLYDSSPIVRKEAKKYIELRKQRELNKEW